MKSFEKETVKAQLMDEQKALKDLEKAYKQAKKDVLDNLKALNTRPDTVDVQTVIHQKRYQETLLKQIDGVLNDLQTHTYKSANEFFQGSYQNGYIGSMYELMKQGIPITVPVNTKLMMTAIQTDSKLSKQYYFKKGLTVQNIRTLKQKIASEVTRGIASGKSWLEVAELLTVQRAFSISQSDAIRIIRTEGNRINQQGRLDAGDVAIKNGCDLLKQWDATLDSRTREAHREADGQIVEWSEEFTVMGEKLEAPCIGGSASNVINCRCQLLKRPRWALDDAELETLKERAKFYGLDKTQSFEEYKDKFLKLPPVSVQMEVIEKINQPTFKDQMKTIRDRVKQQGYASEDDIHEAGKLLKKRLDEKVSDLEKVREEYRNLLDRKGDLDEEVRILSEKIDELLGNDGKDFDPFEIIMKLSESDNGEMNAVQSKIDAILQSKEYQSITERMEELNKIIHRTVYDHAKNLKDTLAEFRKMGSPDVNKGVKKSASKVRDVLVDALDYYPTDWIQYAIDSGGIKTKSVNRGYCDSYENLIAISGWGDEDSFETAIHELGHYFERKVSISNTYVPFDKSKTWWKPYLKQNYSEGQTYILDAERKFYARRTEGEKLVWLGRGYRTSEKTRKDEFISPYMGKDYQGYDFELVSMGFQYAYTEPETLAKDPDMESWIYGILSLY